MAQAGQRITKSFIAGEAMATKWQLVKAATTKQTVDLNDATTDVCIGVIQHDVASGEYVDVAIAGCTKVRVGAGGVSSGDRLMPDGTADVINTGAAGVHTCGIALMDGDEGDIIEMLICIYQLQASIA